MHYCDNSHRWVAPFGVSQRAWEDIMRAHMEEHRASLEWRPHPGRECCGDDENGAAANPGKGSTAAP